MKAIETEWNGYRFRSRTEARWAVFFSTLGWSWQYEQEGYQFKTGERYLPDFFLPDFDMWVEVKGGDPGAREKSKSALLAKYGKKPVILVFGVPDQTSQVYYFDVNGNQRGEKYSFLEDRRNANEFWLFGDQDAFSIGPQFGPDHDRMPIFSKALAHAITEAKQARFEYGEKPKFKPPRWW